MSVLLQSPRAADGHTCGPQSCTDGQSPLSFPFSFCSGVPACVSQAPSPSCPTSVCEGGRPHCPACRTHTHTTRALRSRTSARPPPLRRERRLATSPSAARRLHCSASDGWAGKRVLGKRGICHHPARRRFAPAGASTNATVAAGAASASALPCSAARGHDMLEQGRTCCFASCGRRFRS